MINDTNFLYFDDKTKGCFGLRTKYKVDTTFLLNGAFSSCRKPNRSIWEKKTRGDRGSFGDCIHWTFKLLYEAENDKV